MKLRIISSVGVVVVVTAMLIIGGPVMLILLFLLSLGGMYEIFRLLRDDDTEGKSNDAFKTMMITGGIAVGGWYLMALFLGNNVRSGNPIMLYLLLLIMVLMAEVVLMYPRFTFLDMAITLMAIIYVGMLFSTIYLIRISSGGKFYVWYIFAISWGSDTCAFFTGLSIGRHKMSPKLSPKKTVEGAVGGVIGSLVLCVILGLTLSSAMMIDVGVMLKFSLVAGLLGGIAAEFGDLFASSIKRIMNVKDFSNLIPGHGGILDRFDSVLMVSPLILMLMGLFKMV